MNEGKYEFKIDKECKNSRRYAPVENECPIGAIYVDRSFSEGKDSIYITITDA